MPPADVLVVADSSDAAGALAAAVSRADRTGAVETAVGPEAGLERLSTSTYGCLVSDGLQEGPTGTTLPERVADRQPDLSTVVRLDGADAEAVDRALSAGATDCVREGPGADRLLARRVDDAIRRGSETVGTDDGRRFVGPVLDSVGEVVYLFDAEGRLRQWNDSLVEVTGYAERRLDGMRVAEFFAESDRERVAAAFADVVTGERRRLTGDLVTADGERIPYELTGVTLTDADGTVTGVAGVGRNVSERRRRERARERTIDRVTDAVVSVDDEWRFTSVDDDAEEIYGTGESELLGRECWAVFPETRDTRFEEAYRRAMETREPAEAEAYHEGLDEWFTVEVYPDPGGGLSCYFDEITERKRRERELERQNERLERFTRILSHDLSNPLQVASGRLRLLRGEYDDEDGHLDAVARAHDRMGALIEDMLTLTREAEPVGKRESVDLGELGAECWETVETGEATLSVTTDGTVEADRSRLRQLFENLFDNAVEHGGPGVTVTVGDVDGGFYVADDGPGIPPEQRDRVFDGGYTTRREGTGLGLAIVAEVADAHGWDVRAVEGPDGGARFEVVGVGG